MTIDFQDKAAVTSANQLFSADQLVIIAICIGAVLILGWISFFVVMACKKETINDLIAQTAFLQTLTVIGFGTAATYLAICRIFPPEQTATLFSGMIGYVLGSSTVSRRKPCGPQPRPGGTQHA